MITLNENTVFNVRYFAEQKCSICNCEELGFVVEDPALKKLFQAYELNATSAPETIKHYACLSCILNFLDSIFLSDEEQFPTSSLAYLFPAIIFEYCHSQTREIAKFIPEDIVEDINMLSNSDDEFKQAGLHVEHSVAWWQGATGIEVELYKAIAQKICNEPSEFEGINIIEYSRQQYRLPEPTRLPPVIFAIERLCQTHLAQFAQIKARYDFLQTTDELLY